MNGLASRRRRFSQRLAPVLSLPVLLACGSRTGFDSSFSTEDAQAGSTSGGSVSLGGASAGAGRAGSSSVSGSGGRAGASAIGGGGSGGKGGGSGGKGGGGAAGMPMSCPELEDEQLLVALRNEYPTLTAFLHSPELVRPDIRPELRSPSVPGRTAAALRIGAHDCEAGCQSNWHWYFEMTPASSCAPRLIGHYAEAQDDENFCHRVAGSALWSIPPPLPSPCAVPPRSPAAATGKYQLRGTGQYGNCTGDSFAIDTVIELWIEALDSNLMSVTLMGLGDPRVDGLPLTVFVAGDRLSFGTNIYVESSDCGSNSQLGVQYDFSTGSGWIYLISTDTPDCAQARGTDCQSVLDLTLRP